MLCLCAAQWKFCFQTDLGRQNLASYYMQESTLAFDFSHHGHALVTLYVQSLCYDWSKFDSEFMRKIYAVSWNLFTLTAEADRVLCQLVMFLAAFFYWMYKKWNSAAIKSLLLFVASLFNGFLVEKYVACQSRKSDLGWHRFRFSPCLMRKRVEKSEAIMALLDSFQELHLEW